MKCLLSRSRCTKKRLVAGSCSDPLRRLGQLIQCSPYPQLDLGEGTLNVEEGEGEGREKGEGGKGAKGRHGKYREGNRRGGIGKETTVRNIYWQTRSPPTHTLDLIQNRFTNTNIVRNTSPEPVYTTDSYRVSDRLPRVTCDTVVDHWSFDASDEQWTPLNIKVSCFETITNVQSIWYISLYDSADWSGCWLYCIVLYHVDERWQMKTDPHLASCCCNNDAGIASSSSSSGGGARTRDEKIYPNRRKSIRVADSNG